MIHHLKTMLVCCVVAVPAALYSFMVHTLVVAQWFAAVTASLVSVLGFVTWLKHRRTSRR